MDAPSKKSPAGGPAASVAFVRDTSRGIEVYFSRRPMHFRYFPGAFVFPGGRAEPTDLSLKDTACREVKEEIGVEITPGQLSLLRETHTAAHAGPVYHLFIYACAVTGEMVTEPNPDEIDGEIWLEASRALDQLDLPYQIMAAAMTIARFKTTRELMLSLDQGSFDGEDEP
ncbi:MAG TPA: NUDIX domain-containing protein [Blastocatellia bacterium]